ncbi:MAG: glycosyltransferase family 2 protein, partial [Bacteroidaceae bacterium]|nr:glycosyltransferase family 2 protein [Bacteroidaceae bacterium]
MKLSVIIVNYNVKYYLEQCLRSVMRASEGMDVDIWVVDNASTDDSIAYLQPRFPEVHFIANDENAGFSRANNQAIRQSCSEYVLLLNPDTLVAEDTLRSCVTFMDAHREVGSVGVKMLQPDGCFARESRRGIPTPFTSFCKMVGLHKLFPGSRTFDRYHMGYLNPDEANPIEIISGAFNMLRRSALEQVGLLCEDYFMYGEDIDLSYSLLQKGWKNYYLPCRIMHYKGESTTKSSYRYVHVFYGAMLIFFRRHFSRKYCWLTYLVRLVVVLQASLVYVRNNLFRWLHLQSKSHERNYKRYCLDDTAVST